MSDKDPREKKDEFMQAQEKLMKIMKGSEELEMTWW